MTSNIYSAKAVNFKEIPRERHPTKSNAGQIDYCFV